MSVFAFIVLVIAFVLAIVENRRAWWVPALIVLGIILALVVTHGTMISAH